MSCQPWFSPKQLEPTQDLSNVVWALTKLGIQNAILFNLLADRILPGRPASSSMTRSDCRCNECIYIYIYIYIIITYIYIYIIYIHIYIIIICVYNDKYNIYTYIYIHIFKSLKKPKGFHRSFGFWAWITLYTLIYPP